MSRSAVSFLGYDPNGATGLESSRSLTTEQRLWADVLRFAIDDLFRPKATPNDHRREDAEVWIFGEPIPPVFGITFLDACEHLSIEPGTLRSWLRERMRARAA
jgi:hypothetical protein